MLKLFKMKMIVCVSYIFICIRERHSLKQRYSMSICLLWCVLFVICFKMFMAWSEISGYLTTKWIRDLMMVKISSEVACRITDEILPSTSPWISCSSMNISVSLLLTYPAMLIIAWISVI